MTYGLPNTLTKIVDVKLPGSINIAVGKASPIEFKIDDNVAKRIGGGRQYQILQYPDEDWFLKQTVSNLDGYIKSIRTTSKKSSD